MLVVDLDQNLLELRLVFAGKIMTGVPWDQDILYSGVDDVFTKSYGTVFDGELSKLAG